MNKNVASQKVQLFAFDTTTGSPKTGDAANITAYVSKDHGAVTVLGDTSATEMDSTNAKGVYVFDLTQGETNADELTFTAKSSTANISITPRFVTTNPANFTATVIDSNGIVDADVRQWLGTAVSTPTVAGVPNVNAKTWNDLATVALPLVPTTAGRTLDVSAGGEAGLDWANIGSPATAVNLSGTNIDVDQVVASVSGAVGSVTGLTASNLDVASSTLATAANLAIVAGYLDTEIAAIKTVTDALPNAGALTTIQSDLDNIQTRIPAALTAGGNMKSDVLAISGSTSAADNLEGGGLGLVVSTCAAGSTTTAVATNLTEATDDHYNGRVITFTSGALAGQTTSISDYNGTTKTLTVVALTEAAADTDAFVIS